MADSQTIAELVSQIPVDTRNLLREIKKRRPAMDVLRNYLIIINECRRPRYARSYDRRPTRLLVQGRDTKQWRPGWWYRQYSAAIWIGTERQSGWESGVAVLA